MRACVLGSVGEKESGSGHPLCRLPLLPSGPGGVQQLHVAQSHIGPTTATWTLALIVAEREGFEPSVPFGTHDFQSCSFGHSDISPSEPGAWRRGRDSNPRYPCGYT